MEDAMQMQGMARGTVVASEAGRALVRFDQAHERWASIARGVEADAGDVAVVLLDPDQPIVLATCPGEGSARGRRLVAEEGDLEIGAPNGSVVIRAGTLVRVEGAIVDVASSSTTRLCSGSRGTQVVLTPEGMDLRAGELRSRAKRLRVLADQLEAEGARLEARYERAQVGGDAWTVHAKKITLAGGDLVMNIAGAVQQTAGRVRTIVRGVLSMAADRTRLKSKGRTSIDGEQIHLG